MNQNNTERKSIIFLLLLKYTNIIICLNNFIDYPSMYAVKVFGFCFSLFCVYYISRCKPIL